MAKIRFLDNVPIGVFATNPNGGSGITNSGSFTGSFSGSFIGDLTGTSSYAIFALTSSYFTVDNAITMTRLTEKLEETKSFYVDKLGFSILWEADWFILLATPNGADTISFLVPNHPTHRNSIELLC
jgi:hypothetical protein